MDEETERLLRWAETSHNLDTDGIKTLLETIRRGNSHDPIHEVHHRDVKYEARVAASVMASLGRVISDLGTVIGL